MYCVTLVDHVESVEYHISGIDEYGVARRVRQTAVVQVKHEVVEEEFRAEVCATEEASDELTASSESRFTLTRA